MNPFRTAWRRTLSLLNPAGWAGAWGQTSRPEAFLITGSTAGQAVTPTSALGLSAFWAAVRLTAQTVGSLPIGFYERISDGKRREANEHPLAGILQDSPNGVNTSMEFFEAVVGCLCLRGVFYARIRRNVVGHISALDIMLPDAVTVRREGRANWYYWTDEDGDRHRLAESDVFIVNGWGLGNGGLSPLAFQANVLGIALAADEQAGTVLGSGMSTSGFLEVDAELDPDQRKQLHETMQGFRGSSQAGRMMILESGTKYTPISLRPDEAQLLLSRQMSAEEACRVVGTPPILIGHSSPGQTMFGAGVEEVIGAWVTLSLRPNLVRIEQAIRRQLLTPVERLKFYAEFVLEGLLRADSEARAKLYSTFVQNGIMTRNEVRRLENLPPMPGGGDLTVQVNLVPIGQLGQSPANSAATVRSAALAFLGIDEHVAPPEPRPKARPETRPN